MGEMSEYYRNPKDGIEEWSNELEKLEKDRTRDTYWVTKSGKKSKIKDLSDLHLRNIVNHTINSKKLNKESKLSLLRTIDLEMKFREDNEK